MAVAPRWFQPLCGWRRSREEAGAREEGYSGQKDFRHGEITRQEAGVRREGYGGQEVFRDGEIAREEAGARQEGRHGGKFSRSRHAHGQPHRARKACVRRGCGTTAGTIFAHDASMSSHAAAMAGPG